MNNQALKIHVSTSIGDVSAEIFSPATSRAVMTLAHGAGAGMQHPFMLKLSQELAESGIATLRFQFPYMERKSKRVDPAPIAEKTVSRVIETALDLFPNLPVIVAGKSFGGRMSSQLLCKHTFTGVKAMVFYGFPLHPAGNPGVERAKHLKDIELPMLFLQGTKDELAYENLIVEVCKELPTSTLEFIEKADHSFKVGKKDSIDILSKKSVDWLTTLNIL